MFYGCQFPDALTANEGKEIQTDPDFAAAARALGEDAEVSLPRRRPWRRAS
jgi:hypothetical protein